LGSNVPRRQQQTKQLGNLNQQKKKGQPLVLRTQSTAKGLTKGESQSTKCLVDTVMKTVVAKGDGKVKKRGKELETAAEGLHRGRWFWYRADMWEKKKNA